MTERTRKSKKASKPRRRRTVKRKTTEKKVSYPIPKGLPYDKLSYILFYAGVILGLLGFYLMWKGDAIASVITIVIGFVLLIPVALYRRGKNGEKEAQQAPNEQG